MKITNKVAIVTGSSRGIGKAVALRLAADGFAVIVNYASNEQSAEEVVARIKQQGGDAIAIKADVADEAAVQSLFTQTIENFGRVDVVVNSAGVMHNATISKNSLPSFAQVIRTNLQGCFVVMAQAAEHLQQGGRFIALSSSVLAKNFPTYGSYIASKAGVEGLVRVFANELRGKNICVNAVAPGPVETELFLEGKTPEQIANIVQMAPLQRLGQPEDIAALVAFLSSPEGGWVNGQILRANGGFA